jgi:hypothetical protein
MPKIRFSLCPMHCYMVVEVLMCGIKTHSRSESHRGGFSSALGTRGAIAGTDPR